MDWGAYGLRDIWTERHNKLWTGGHMDWGTCGLRDIWTEGHLD